MANRSLSIVEADLFRKRGDLREKVTRIYGHKKTAEDKEFTEKNAEQATCQRLAPIFFMSLWVAIASQSTIFMIIIQHHKMSRCVVESLEGNFTFDQILHMTVSDQNAEKDQYCYYDDRDYANYITQYNGNYTTIMEAIRNESTTPKKIECTNVKTIIKAEFDDIGDVVIVDDVYNSYCAPYLIKRAMPIALKYGQVTLSIPLGVLGDYYGRKTSFIIGGSLFITGTILTLIPNLYVVIFGRYLIGTATIVYYSVYVLFLESCDRKRRAVTAMLIYEGLAFSKFIEYMLYRVLRNCYQIMIINTIFALAMIYIMIVIKESPRWLYFRGNKRKCFRLLGEDRPDLPEEIERKSLLEHFKNFTLPVFRKRITINFVAVLGNSSAVYLVRSKFSRAVTHFTLRFILDSGFSLAIVILLTYAVMNGIGRIQTLITWLSITTCLGAMLMINPLIEEFTIQLALVMHLCITELATCFGFYCLCELYPNEFRFTAYGIITSGQALSEIFLHHFRVYQIRSKSLHYLPIFISSTVAMTISHFLQETKTYGMPDYPREAIGDETYIEIVRSMAHNMN